MPSDRVQRTSTEDLFRARRRGHDQLIGSTDLRLRLRHILATLARILSISACSSGGSLMSSPPASVQILSARALIATVSGPFWIEAASRPYR